MDRLWITWEQQRRNRSMSRALGAELLEICVKGGRIRRYILSSVITMRAILRKSPKTLFVQNPSLVLAALAVVISKLRGFRLVIDAHNAGVFPAEGRSRLLLSITRLINESADLVIVSNENLEDAPTTRNALTFSMPDPLPELMSKSVSSLEGGYNVLFICTWAEDEPYTEVIRAAWQLPATITIYITGNYDKVGLCRESEEVPPNVKLTGFVSDEEFDAILRASDVIMDLTRRQDCLVCGAYEAIAAEKPLILSDTLVNREYFLSGVLYTENTPPAIKKAIEDSYLSRTDLQVAICYLKTKLLADWEKRKLALEDLLDASSRTMAR